MTESESLDAQSAKSYALVGFIFYVLSAVGTLIPMLFFGLFSGWLNEPPFNADIPFALGPLVLLFFAIPLALNAGFAAWSWITVDNIGKGKYAEARTATLILGIFGIFLAWFIGGIFLLLAYGKLGDVIKGPQVSQAPPQRVGRMCTNCGRPVQWDAKFCEHCGKDLA
ncbi:MAG: zinc ribbon domain-containing protein [Nitrososphaerales archaeon]